MGSNCCKCANDKKNKHLTSTSSNSSGPWTRGDVELVGERFSSVTQRGAVTLNVRNATVGDSGRYSLSARNDAGHAHSDLLLEVRTRPGDVPVFLRRLNDLAVKVGTRTRFLVEIRSPTQVKVSWEQEGKPVVESERFHLLHEGNFFCVDVAPVTLGDAGLWICRAHNANGTATCFCHLNVLVPKAYKAPHFIEELVAILTEQGTVSLECKVVGVPTPTLRWFKDNQEIKAGDVFALSANPQDATSLGTYTCEATNCMGRAYSTSRVHVLGKDGAQPIDSLVPKGPAPVFSKELRNDKVKIGGKLTLSCKVNVPPWPQSIMWFNKEGVVESGGRYHIIEDGLGSYSVEVDPVEAVDEGEWKCVATSSQGVKGITTCNVSVSYPKNYKKPKFLESLKAILTEEGLVSFECKVVGYPTPQLRWFKDGQELKPGDVYQLTGTNSLGSYCCIAKNCMGETSSTAELTVEDIQSQLNEEERLQLYSKNQPPRFLQGLKSLEAKIMDPLRLTVQVSVSPQPSVAWYRDDEEVQESDRYKKEQETKGFCHLIIKRLELMDQAEWKCVATNDYGQSVTSCFLKLSVPRHYKKPRFLENLRAVLSEEGAVNLECKVIGVPQPTLKWYKDGRELKPGDIHRIISGQDGTCCLGTYTCEATNCMGTVSSSASLLGFEDRAQVKPQPEPLRPLPPPAAHLVRHPSLSTILEERTSQLHDTVTSDERAEVSFSFDGKEVSVSLYETPDLTEEEALQVVEMYAEELSEHISEHNVVELPPMRFVKETSQSGHLLMEAVVIDVSPEYYASAEDRTEADLDEFSITEDNGFMSPQVLTPEEMPFDKFTADFLERSSQLVQKAVPVKPPRKRGADNSESSYHSLKEAKLSPEEESSEFADALSSIKDKSQKDSFDSEKSGAEKSGGKPAEETKVKEDTRRTENLNVQEKEDTQTVSKKSRKKSRSRSRSAEFQSVENDSDIASEKKVPKRPLKKRKSTDSEKEDDSLCEFERQKCLKADVNKGLDLENSQKIDRTKKGKSSESEKEDDSLREFESRKSSYRNDDSQDKPAQKAKTFQKKQLSDSSGKEDDSLIEYEKTKHPTEGVVEKSSSKPEKQDRHKVPLSKSISTDSSEKDEAFAIKSDQSEQSRKRKKRSIKKSSATEKKTDTPETGAEIPPSSEAESCDRDSLKNKRVVSTSDLDRMRSTSDLDSIGDKSRAQEEEEHSVDFDTAEDSAYDKSEMSVLESLTHSIKEIKKGLAALEEKVISESTEEPQSAKSTLSAIESLVHPINEIQRGLIVVEKQAEETEAGQYSPSSILETLKEPIQELGRNLAEIEKVNTIESEDESLLKKTSQTLLQTVSHPLQELQKELNFIQQQAIIETGEETFSDVLQSFKPSLLVVQGGVEHTEGDFTSKLEDLTDITVLPQGTYAHQTEQTQSNVKVPGNQEALDVGLSDSIVPLTVLDVEESLAESSVSLSTLGAIDLNNELQVFSEKLETCLNSLNKNAESTNDGEVKDILTSLGKLVIPLEQFKSVIEKCLRLVGENDKSSDPQVRSSNMVLKATLESPVHALGKCLNLLDIVANSKSSKEIRGLGIKILYKLSFPLEELKTTMKLIENLSEHTSIELLVTPVENLISAASVINLEASKSGFAENIPVEGGVILRELDETVGALSVSVASMTKSLSSQSSLCTLSSLTKPLADFKKNLNKIENEIKTPEKFDKVTTTEVYNLAQDLCRPLQAIRTELSIAQHEIELDQYSHLSLLSDPVQDNTLESATCIIHQSLEQVHKIILTSTEFVLSKSPSETLYVRYLLFALNELILPLNQLNASVIKAKETLSNEVQTSVQSNIGISAVSSSASEVLSVLSNLRHNSLRSAALPEIHIVQLLSTMEEPLLDVERGLRKISEHSYEGDKNLLNINMLKTLAEPFKCLQKSLINIYKNLKPESVSEEIFLELRQPIQELQRSILIIQDQVSFEYGDEPASIESNIVTLQSLINPLSALKNRFIELDKLITDKTISMSCSKENRNIHSIIKISHELQLKLSSIMVEENYVNKHSLDSLDMFPIFQDLTRVVGEFENSLKRVDLVCQNETKPDIIAYNKLCEAVKSFTQEAGSFNDKIIVASNKAVKDVKHPVHILKKGIEPFISRLADITQELENCQVDEQSVASCSMKVYKYLQKSFEEFYTFIQETDKFIEDVDRNSTELSILSSSDTIKDVNSIVEEISQSRLSLETSNIHSFNTKAHQKVCKEIKTFCELLKFTEDTISESSKSKINLLNVDQKKERKTLINTFSSMVQQLQKIESYLMGNQEVKESISCLINTFEMVQENLNSEGDISKVKILETLNVPLKNFKEIISKAIDTSVIVSEVSQPVSSYLERFEKSASDLELGLMKLEHALLNSTGDFSSLKNIDIEVIAHPIEELAGYINSIEEQQTYNVSETLVDQSSLSMLKTLAQPIQEIKEGVLLIQEQIALEASGKTPSGKSCAGILYEIAKPIRELRSGVALIQEQIVMEPDIEPFSDETRASSLLTFAAPIEEMKRVLSTVVEQQPFIFEADGQSMSEDISVLKTIAQPVKELQNKLATIEINQIMESGVEPLSVKENILALAKPVQILQESIAQVESQIALEATSENLNLQNNVSMLKKIAKPLIEISKGIAVIFEQQFIEEGNVEDVPSISECSTLANITDVSLNDVAVHVGETVTLEQELSFKDDTVLPQLVKTTIEGNREIGVIEQQQILMDVNSLSENKQGSTAKYEELNPADSTHLVQEVLSAVQIQEHDVLSQADTFTASENKTILVADFKEESLNLGLQGELQDTVVHLENLSVKKPIAEIAMLKDESLRIAAQVIVQEALLNAEKLNSNDDLSITHIEPETLSPCVIQGELQQSLADVESLETEEETLQSISVQESLVQFESHINEIQEALSDTKDFTVTNIPLCAADIETSTKTAAQNEVRQTLDKEADLKSLTVNTEEADFTMITPNVAAETEIQQLISNLDDIKNVIQPTETAKFGEESLQCALQVQSQQFLSDVESLQSELLPEKYSQEVKLEERPFNVAVKAQVQEFFSVANQIEAVKNELQAKVTHEPSINETAKQEVQKVLQIAENIISQKEEFQLKINHNSDENIGLPKIEEVVSACEKVIHNNESPDKISKAHPEIKKDMETILSLAKSLASPGESPALSIPTETVDIITIDSTLTERVGETVTETLQTIAKDNQVIVNDQPINESKEQSSFINVNKEVKDLPAEKISHKEALETPLQQFVIAVENVSQTVNTLQAKLISNPDINYALQQEFQEMLSTVNDLKTMKDSLQEATNQDQSMKIASHVEIQQMLIACENFETLKELVNAKVSKDPQVYSPIESEIQQILMMADSFQTVKQSVLANITETEMAGNIASVQVQNVFSLKDNESENLLLKDGVIQGAEIDEFLREEKDSSGLVKNETTDENVGNIIDGEKKFNLVESDKESKSSKNNTDIHKSSKLDEDKRESNTADEEEKTSNVDHIDIKPVKEEIEFKSTDVKNAQNMGKDNSKVEISKENNLKESIQFIEVQEVKEDKENIEPLKLEQKDEKEMKREEDDNDKGSIHHEDTGVKKLLVISDVKDVKPPDEEKSELISKEISVCDQKQALLNKEKVIKEIETKDMPSETKVLGSEKVINENDKAGVDYAEIEKLTTLKDESSNEEGKETTLEDRKSGPGEENIKAKVNLDQEVISAELNIEHIKSEKEIDTECKPYKSERKPEQETTEIDNIIALKKDTETKHALEAEGLKTETDMVEKPMKASSEQLKKDIASEDLKKESLKDKVSQGYENQENESDSLLKTMSEDKIMHKTNDEMKNALEKIETAEINLEDKKSKIKEDGKKELLEAHEAFVEIDNDKLKTGKESLEPKMQEKPKITVDNNKDDGLKPKTQKLNETTGMGTKESKDSEGKIEIGPHLENKGKIEKGTQETKTASVGTEVQKKSLIGGSNDEQEDNKKKPHETSNNAVEVENSSGQTEVNLIKHEDIKGLKGREEEESCNQLSVGAVASLERKIAEEKEIKPQQKEIEIGSETIAVESSSNIKSKTKQAKVKSADKTKEIKTEKGFSEGKPSTEQSTLPSELKAQDLKDENLVTEDKENESKVTIISNTLLSDENLISKKQDGRNESQVITEPIKQSDEISKQPEIDKEKSKKETQKKKEIPLDQSEDVCSLNDNAKGIKHDNATETSPLEINKAIQEKETKDIKGNTSVENKNSKKGEKLKKKTETVDSKEEFATVTKENKIPEKIDTEILNEVENKETTKKEELSSKIEMKSDIEVLNMKNKEEIKGDVPSTKMEINPTKEETIKVEIMPVESETQKVTDENGTKESAKLKIKSEEAKKGQTDTAKEMKEEVDQVIGNDKKLEADLQAVKDLENIKSEKSFTEDSSKNHEKLDNSPKTGAVDTTETKKIKEIDNDKQTVDEKDGNKKEKAKAKLKTSMKDNKKTPKDEIVKEKKIENEKSGEKLSTNIGNEEENSQSLKQDIVLKTTESSKEEENSQSLKQDSVLKITEPSDTNMIKKNDVSGIEEVKTELLRKTEDTKSELIETKKILPNENKTQGTGSENETGSKTDSNIAKDDDKINKTEEKPKAKVSKKSKSVQEKKEIKITTNDSEKSAEEKESEISKTEPSKKEKFQIKTCESVDEKICGNEGALESKIETNKGAALEEVRRLHEIKIEPEVKSLEPLSVDKTKGSVEIAPEYEIENAVKKKEAEENLSVPTKTSLIERKEVNGKKRQTKKLKEQTDLSEFAKDVQQNIIPGSEIEENRTEKEENKLNITLDESSTSDYGSESYSEPFHVRKSQSYDTRKWVHDSKSKAVEEAPSVRSKHDLEKKYEIPSFTESEKISCKSRQSASKPLFCGRLVDRTAAQGSKLKVTCSLTGSPDPTVQWFKDGHPIDTSIDHRIRTRLSNGLASLEIVEAKVGDSGKYTCTARNTHGEATTTANIKVFSYLESAPEAPVFTQQIRDHYKSASDELVMECRVKGHPQPSVTWTKDGQTLRPITRYEQSVLTDGTCRLVIHGPEASDSGLYKCVAENAVWSEQTSAHVTFEGREKYLAESRSLADPKVPRFTNIVSDTVVREGGTLALQVAVKGTPRAEVTWYRGSEPLPKRSSRYRYLEDAGVYTLVMTEASAREAGTYTCRASNAHGYRDTSVNVEIVGTSGASGVARGKPAMFLSRPDTSLGIAVGEDISFSFRVSGDPKPRVTWMKGMKDITNNNRTMKETVNDYVRLTLKHATVLDAGTYFIMAKNIYGADHAFVTVRVKQRARSLTPTRATIWSGPDTSTILRDIHESTRAMVNDVPGPVSSAPVVSDCGKNWLSLSWGKPDHRGAAPVLAYRVEAWQLGTEGGAQWTELGVTPINSFDVFFLKPGSEYKFRVTARNRYGWGESVTTAEPISVGSAANFPPDIVRDLPGPLKALHGDNVTLECEISGDPPPTVQWLRDGQNVGTLASLKGRVFVSDDQLLHRLIIKQLTEDDSGRYVCEAVNKVGRASTYARLLVVNDPRLLDADRKLKESVLEQQESAPQFTMRLRDRRVQQSYPVRLSCQVIGNPTPDISWAHQGQPITADDRHQIVQEADHFHTLEITRTLLEDSGEYTATAHNCLGAVSCHCQLIVDKGIRAYISPEFTSELSPAVTVREGAELRLFAQVEAYPTVSISWQRDGVRLRPSRRLVMTLDPEGRVELALAHLTVRDAGLYTCCATNAVGRAETVCQVFVTGGGPAAATADVPAITTSNVPYSKEPRFVTKPRSSEAVEGDTVVITCEVVGDPQPEVMWLRDWLKPGYYRDAPQFRQVSGGSGSQYSLEIPQVKLDFTGTYCVIARNPNGEAKAIISLQIYAKGQGKESSMVSGHVKHGQVQTLPEIKRELRDVRCCDGDAVTLECVVSASPPPAVRWEKDGKILPLGEDIEAELDGEIARLTIKKVYPEDEGQYACVAYNDLGRAVTSACLVVDVPEEKETLLSQQLTRPPGLLSARSTPRSTPRNTPSPARSLSPAPTAPRYREFSSPSFSRPKRVKMSSPKFYTVPHNRIAEEGETVRFQCSVAGHPTPWASWDKDGHIVTPSSRLSVTERDDVRTLELREVTVEDAGLYRVTLENEMGSVEATARLDIIGRQGSRTRSVRAWSAVRSSPTFGRRLVGSAARVGGTFTLTCDVHASPSPVTSWYRNGEMLVKSSRVVPSWDGRRARLELRGLQPEDAGVYTCVAENAIGTTQCSAELRVLQTTDPSDADLQPPVFLQGLPPEQTAAEGQPFELQVRLQGSSPLEVVWVKDGVEVPDCPDLRHVDYGDGRFGLRIADVFTADGGIYNCEAFNDHGDAITSGHLIVNDLSGGESGSTEPEIMFTKTPSPVLARLRGQASFCARLQSCPLSHTSFTWTVNGRSVNNDDRFKVTTEEDCSILHIAEIRPSDVGSVVCTARVCSPAVPPTTVSCDTTLGLDPTPGAPAELLRGPCDTTAMRGDRVLLKATYRGDPEPSVRWLKAGREMSSEGRVQITSRDGVSCLTISAIDADDSGKYVVSVENIHGADCHYASVAVEGPPEAPAARPSVSTAGEGCVTVAWSSPPYDGGCVITGYQVEMRTALSHQWTVVADRCHSLSHVVRGLTPGQTYLFRVRAENIHGASESSAESFPFMLQSPHSGLREEEGEVEGELDAALEPRLVTLEPGDQFLERYSVHEELGKGRYGVVHKVTDLRTGHTMAAKFVRCIKKQDREKVQEEIDIMNCLRHPKLLQLTAAFDNPKDMIMVMEYISGGELFERVVADDFTLTERDCILFLRQICEGVRYMHTCNVVHLDLKPENIMCHTRTSHRVKIIDFGLAQKLESNTPVRVLFGTPEFIPPEIINYEPIGVESDMWSVGVICYVLLSGLSPFMGDNDAETFANITRADFDFDDEAFEAISQDAKDFISSLLVKRKEKRLTAEECLQHKWLIQSDTTMNSVKLCTDKLKKFIIRRKWQKTGNAIRALGRMATLSAASRRSSSASSPPSPRPSLSASRMSEEVKGDRARGRVCSERSDSGISDCSSINTNTTPTTPRHLLNKKYSICEEPEKDLSSCRLTEHVVSVNKLSDSVNGRAANISNVSVAAKKRTTNSLRLDSEPAKAPSPTLQKDAKLFGKSENFQKAFAFWKQ